MTPPLRIVCVGGGPGGLYFALLMKKADPRRRVSVIERNRPDDTFGFGVVFSDQTMAGLAEADREVFDAIGAELVHWDDIAVHYGGEVVRSTGHGFSGMSRHTLLRVLQTHARNAGVEIVFEREVVDLDAIPEADLVVASDGVNSTMRRALAAGVRTEIDVRPNRFVWLGTTKPFPAFTFYFRTNAHGLWRVHAYQYAPGASTFIVECRDETWRAAGLEAAGDAETVAYLEHLFAEELDGHRLIADKSIWRQFPTIRVTPWSVGHTVFIGDAAHTAHFSVGSGTRLAMEDAVALRDALHHALDGAGPDTATAIRAGLAAYDAARRPQVESLQRAAHASLQWFEDTERYMRLPPVQFAFTLLTRSLRITHEELKVRDPEFVARLDAFVASEAARQVGPTGGSPRPAPPMFTPVRLRDLVIPNRVAVSPMCQYVAEEGTVGDWHLVHLGSRAMGGAGLVMAEMTDVSADARISPGCAGLYTGDHARAWKRIVDFIHETTPAKVGIQLGHAGRKGATKRMWEGDTEPLPAGAQWPLLSASALPYFPDRSPVPRAMSRADMQTAIEEYVRATHHAIEAGFDLLEVHMAHGYLLASFLSPLTNTRDDEYGGGLEARLRFPLEVFDACRAVWPAERPMSVRISAVDWAPGGMTPDEAVEVARALGAHGCDIVDVSAGQTVPDQRPVYGRLFQTPFADRIRHDAGIQTMAVGNISSFTDVNTIIAAGRADLCLLARAHLFDPYWTRHAAFMQQYALPWPSPYASLDRYQPRFEFRL
ncbi:MAG: bifunctional salicylyl-CoA 5-hydroxylase/oxidoreductase [Vicinamibacterales bacterium]|nr:bifunctional salicylyl-CoA 5-hydroxylase/oxidoreductase [Vicinamibacterales bacterium]